MISRVADHCFWFGRYLERAENTARVLPVTSAVALDAELSARQSWRPVVVVAGEEQGFLARFGDAAVEDAESVQRFLTWDRQNFTSIASSIHAVRDTARSIREVLSLDVWQTVNELWLWFFGDAAEELYESDREQFYRHIRDASLLVLGALRNTMLHDLPLDFVWLGAVLERANQTARILDMQYHLDREPRAERDGAVDDAVCRALLRACSGLEAFMQREARLTPDAVARFLVLEPRHPRAIRFCVQEARERFARIRPTSDLPGERSAARLAALHARLADPGPIGDLHSLLTHVVDEIAAISNEIGRELLGVSTGASAEPPDTPKSQ